MQELCMHAQTQNTEKAQKRCCFFKQPPVAFCTGHFRIALTAQPCSGSLTEEMGNTKTLRTGCTPARLLSVSLSLPAELFWVCKTSSPLLLLCPHAPQVFTWSATSDSLRKGNTRIWEKHRQSSWASSEAAPTKKLETRFPVWYRWWACELGVEYKKRNKVGFFLYSGCIETLSHWYFSVQWNFSHRLTISWLSVLPLEVVWIHILKCIPKFFGVKWGTLESETASQMPF